MRSQFSSRAAGLFGITHLRRGSLNRGRLDFLEFGKGAEAGCGGFTGAAARRGQ